MQEKRFVIPDDMGHTLELGSAQPDKWNVKHDGSLRIDEEGRLGVNPECIEVSDVALFPEVPAVFESGFDVINTRFCFYGQSTPDKPVVGVPNVTLENVTLENADALPRKVRPYNNDGDSYTGGTFSFCGTALLTPGLVVKTLYVNGVSWRSYAILSQIIPSQTIWSDWVRLDNVEAAASGLDCEAINALPKKPWKTGTSIVAIQDGQCIKLAPVTNIFQDIAVGIVTDKKSVSVGRPFNLIITLTNVGETSVDSAEFHVLFPILANFTKTTPVITAKGTSAEAQYGSDTVFLARNLIPGATVRIVYTVTPNAPGVLGFSVSASSTSEDLLGDNNYSATTISVTDNYAGVTPTTDCPLISATLDDKPLLVTAFSPGSFDGRSTINPPTGKRIQQLNVVDQPSLNGLRIKIPSASTIVVYASKKTAPKGFSTPTSIVLSNGKMTHTGDGGLFPYSPTDSLSHKNVVNGYTFTDGELVFTDDYIAANVCMRTGKNCAWQSVLLAATYTIEPYYTVSVSGVDHEVVGYTTTSTTHPATEANYSANLPEGLSPQFLVQDPTAAKIGERTRINLNSGEAKTFDVTVNGDNLDQFFKVTLNGAIKSVISNNGKTITITTTDRVSTQDSVTVDIIDLVVT